MNEELLKIIKENREKFIKELLGEEVDEERVDFCYVCGKPFRESQAIFHEKCGTYKCVHCGACYCDLPPEAQKALDMEMISLGIWLNPYHNPPTRKKRVTKLEFVSESEFRSWVAEWWPELSTLSTEEMKKELYKRYPKLRIHIG